MTDRAPLSRVPRGLRVTPARLEPAVVPPPPRQPAPVAPHLHPPPPGEGTRPPRHTGIHSQRTVQVGTHPRGIGVLPDREIETCPLAEIRQDKIPDLLGV